MDVQEIVSVDYWKAFAPEFHIADVAFFNSMGAFNTTPEQQAALNGQLKEEGYFQANVNWGVDMNKMADTVRRLSAANLSPVFAFLYDEYWVPFFRLHVLYSSFLGEKYYFLPDFWVWNVDPQKSESGWQPHRDKGRMSLFPDRSPKSLTTWIPMSSATPLNGCMYIVPAMHDRTYGTEQEQKWEFEYSSIRALPGNPGDFFVWNQAVLHWGSKTSPRAPESRVSMAFEFQRADVEPFNKPLIPPLSVLPFETRLKLVAKQILQYKHMYKLEPEIESIAQKLIA